MSDTKTGEFLEALSENKLARIAGAILSETAVGKGGRIIGKVAGILGTSEEPDAIKEAIKTANPEQMSKLAEIQAGLEKAELEAAEAAGRELTERHKTDMMSDNVLSKNVRPVLFIAAVSACIIYHFVGAGCLFLEDSMSADQVDAILSLAENLHRLALYFAAFYVGARTVEKPFSKWDGKIFRS